VQHIEKHLANGQAPPELTDLLRCQRWRVCDCKVRIEKEWGKGCADCKKLPQAPYAPPDPRALAPPRPEGAPPHPSLGDTLAPPSDERELVVAGLPSLHDIFARKVNTLQLIPIAARNQFLAELTHVFHDVVGRPGDASWRRLAAFTKCILAPPNRAGKSKKGSLDVVITDRLALWRNGEVGKLWGSIPPPARSANTKTSVQAKVIGATKLARQGFYSRAVSRLMSEGVQASSAEVVEKMRQLHPEGTNPAFSQDPMPQALRQRVEEKLEAGDVKRCLLSFDGMTACGAMGLKIPHLRAVLATDKEGVFLRTARKFVLHCAFGEAFSGAQPFLAGACLTALKKKPKTAGAPPGTRPVAAGEICRRLVAKAALGVIRERLDETFLPEMSLPKGHFRGQFGVGAKCGTERVVHLARTVCNAHSADEDFVCVKVDATNAFNLVSRHHFESALKDFPELLPWVSWAYGHQATLWFGEHELASACGVQQGDPLGPLIFALVILPLVKKLDTLGLAANLWYLDDGFIAGTHAAVNEALRILASPEATGKGLLLNASKCEAIWLSEKAVRQDAIPAHFSDRIRDGNFDLLGSPIGTTQYCCEYAELKVFGRAREAWAAMETVDDVQVALTLLRQCAHFNRVNHLMRTVPPSQIRPALRKFDKELRAAFGDITGLHLGDAAWRQAKLATSIGGLGLRSADEHAAAAYLASTSFVVKAHKLNATDFQDATDAWVEMRRVFPSDTALSEALGDPHPQRVLSVALDQHEFASMLSTVTQYDKGRLSSCAQKGATAWINARPTVQNSLTSAEMSAALRFWLGEDVYQSDHLCPVCRTETADARGFHSLTCTYGGSHLHRHNAVRDVFVVAAKRAGFKPRTEPAHLLGFSKGDRPADFETTEGGTTVANDVCVFHPLRPAFLNATVAKAGSAHAMYVKHEKEKYVKPCADAGITFRPLCADVFTAFDETATKAIKKMAKADAMVHDCDHAEVVCALRQSLSIAIMRGNAKSILRRASADAHPLLDEPFSATFPSSSLPPLVPESSSAARAAATSQTCSFAKPCPGSDSVDIPVGTSSSSFSLHPAPIRNLSSSPQPNQQSNSHWHNEQAFHAPLPFDTPCKDSSSPLRVTSVPVSSDSVRLDSVPVDTDSVGMPSVSVPVTDD
jgi:hypothetical protein